MRTYGSRARTFRPPSPAETTPEPPSSSPSSSKRPAEEPLTASKPGKRFKATQAKFKGDKPKQKTLVQLHFCIDQSIVKTCPLCGLCYTKGATEDVALHKSHCTRVQKGMEWSKEEDKEGYGKSITEVKSRAKLKNGKVGRIIAFPGDVGGKMGAKLSALLHTINLCLSSPEITKSTLQSCKVYLFLLPQEGTNKPERIIGCVIAQRIETAMDVINPTTNDSPNAQGEPKPAPVDVSGVFCNPQRLPTPMGISRLFVPSSHRRQGVARALLSTAAETFIPGCPLDPLKSQIAFSQPTGDGNKVMQSWGGGKIRIYEED